VVSDHGRCDGQTGRLIRRSTTVEASSLGAAICAAIGAGLHGSAADAAERMCDPALRDTHPHPENRERYSQLLDVYRDLYPSLRNIFSRLAGHRR